MTTLDEQLRGEILVILNADMPMKGHDLLKAVRVLRLTNGDENRPTGSQFRAAIFQLAQWEYIEPWKCSPRGVFGGIAACIEEHHLTQLAYSLTRRGYDEQNRLLDADRASRTSQMFCQFRPSQE